MHAEPQKEHQWLHKFVGEWTYETVAEMKPGEPPSTFTGSERVRSIGGLWVQGEGQGEMPGGGAATMVITLGYDPRRGRYVGTWLGSMMTHLWVYEGSVDAAGRVLTLDTEGPSMSDPAKLTRYQDVFEFRGDDQRVLTARVLGDDGQWQQIMTTTYRRKK